MRLKVEFADGNRRETVLPFTAGQRVEHVLFEQGKTRYRLVVGAQASDSERWAASELRRRLQDVSGVSLGDGAESDLADDRVIVVGWNQRTQQLLGPGGRCPAGLRRILHLSKRSVPRCCFGGNNGEPSTR